MLHIDARAISLASRQGGVITRRQALDLGLTSRQIDYRLSTSRWHRVGDLGYRLVPSSEPHQLLLATSALVPGAVVSHESAAHMHRIQEDEPSMPTMSVHSRTTHDLPGVDVRRCHDLLESHVTEIGGLSVTTVERTIFDLAPTRSLGSLSWTVGRLASDGRLSYAALVQVVSEIGRRGKPGTALMRELLESLDMDESEESPLERRGRRLLDDATCTCGYISEYPMPWSPRRRFDDAFPSHRVAVEWDSVRFHGQRESFERDRQRDREAVQRGWLVLRFTWADVTTRPQEVVRTVNRTLNCQRTLR